MPIAQLKSGENELKVTRSLLGVLVLVSGSLLSEAGFAATLQTGSVIRLADSYGTSGGGEFLATVVGGTSADSFITFCMEKNEYFTPGQNLYVSSVSTEARAGGIAGGNPDPISAQTAYLYTIFSAGTLGGYDYLNIGSARIADANSLQKAFWYLEQEIPDTELDSQARAWVNAANTAVSSGNWIGLGNVRVLNLYQDAAYTIRAQDQLYIAPIPEPDVYAMMAAGLGLMGFVARRRQRQVAA